MSAGAEFVAYVQDLLTPLGPLGSGSFFGGHAFKYQGQQFAMVMGNTVYFRVSASSRLGYERQGMAPFSYLTKRGRVQVKKYYAVPLDVLESQDTLLQWARLAIADASL